MALRAGYYGVKHRIWEALQKTVLEDTQEIADIRSEQSVLGAKNLLENTATSQSVNGVSFVVNADGTVTANNKATANATLRLNKIYNLPSGTYKYTGCPSGGGSSTYQGWIGIRNAGDTAWISSHTDTGNGVEFSVDASQTSYVQVEIEVRNNYTADNLLFNPMIRLSTDPGATYAPYAMTNQQLTTNKVSKTLTSTNTAATIFSESTKVSSCTAILNDLLVSLRLTSISGASASGSWTTIATLNGAYRPAGLVYEVAIDDAGVPYGWVRIHGDTGVVEVYQGSGSAKVVNLSTLYFRSASASANRDAAPEERSLEVDEPAVVKKSTRKKTTKSEEEE